MQSAFEILISRPATCKAVLINIFGGIIRCDRIAAGVVAALGALGECQVPVVVRLEGTNVEEGRRILAESDFDFIVAGGDGRRRREGRGGGRRGILMAIWVNETTRLLVQGITGGEGRFHALGCRDYGTNVVAGVTPGKGGEQVEGVPVFDTVAEARAGDRLPTPR